MTATQLLEQMTMSEFDALDRERTLIAIPVSPLEAHGPHLPLGMDGYMALQLADRVLDLLASRRPDWTFVRAPWLPVGCYTIHLPGSVEVPQETVREAVAAFGHALARQGFRNMVVLNGHGGPGHNAALEEACRLVSRRHGVRMNYPLARVLTDVMKGKYTDRIAGQLGRPLSEEEQFELAHDFHAGWMETSLALDHHPELVKGDPADLPPVKHSLMGMLRYWWGDLVGRGPGYVGYPAKADPALGRAVEEVLRIGDGLLPHLVMLERPTTMRHLHKAKTHLRVRACKKRHVFLHSH